MAVLGLPCASVEDGWLPSHQSGEFVITFCLSLFINIVSASYLHLEQEPFIRDHTDLLLEIKRKALEQVELHWNPAMKDEVEILGDVQLYAM